MAGGFKKGLILVNAYTRSETELNQPKRLKEELEKRGIEAEIKRNDFFPVIIDGGNVTSRIHGYDFCVYLDKDKYVSEMLESAGLRLFNSHSAIRICDDKMRTFITLAGRGLKMPKTLAGLLCYTEDAHVKENEILVIEAELGYPVVIKESYGSLGKGVYLAKDRTELTEVMTHLKGRPHVFQRFIGQSRGTDARIIVIGGKAIGGMLRRSVHDFRSNVELGGEAVPYNPPPEVSSAAQTAAKVIGLDYCGVDVLFAEDGPCICEVNSNAFFGGFEKVTGINVAKRYAEHIIKEIYGSD